MKKLLSIFILTVLISSGTVYANSEDKPPSYEEIYTDWGYSTIKEALLEFENHFNKKLALPLRLPPITFTHHFGKFIDLKGDINDSFNMKFVNEQHPENHYSIDVKPVENRIKFNERQIVDTYKLKDGTNATYISFSHQQVGFNGLVFQRDNWQFVLRVDKRAADIVTPEVLVEIANSFHSGS